MATETYYIDEVRRFVCSSLGVTWSFDYIEVQPLWAFPMSVRLRAAEEGDIYHIIFLVARDELLERGLIKEPA